MGDPAWFISSVIDGPGRRRVILRGDIGAVGADRLRAHLADILATAVQHIIVDASDVRRCDPLVVQLLGRTQEQLGARRGLITVIGLPPSMRPPLVATPVARTEHPARMPVPESGAGQAPAAARPESERIVEHGRATADTPAATSRLHGWRR